MCSKNFFIDNPIKFDKVAILSVQSLGDVQTMNAVGQISLVARSHHIID